MEAVLNRLGTPIGIMHAGVVMYAIDWGHIAPLSCQWSRNRSPDPARVDALVAHMAAGGYVPPLMHFAELKGEASPLACFDGNHRREGYARRASAAGAGDRYTIIAAVRFNAMPEQVEADFRAINSAVSVPELYTRAAGGPPREELLALAQSYVTTYPRFLSASAHCTAPHFNRDVLVDNLDALCRSLSIDVATLAAGLQHLNGALAAGRLSLKARELYPARAVEKCRAHGLWLFLDGRIVAAAAVAAALQEQTHGVSRAASAASAGSAASAATVEPSLMMVVDRK